MTPLEAKAVRTAAEYLRLDAQDLRASHTVADKWPASEGEALRQYNLLNRLAGQLDRIANRSAGK